MTEIRSAVLDDDAKRLQEILNDEIDYSTWMTVVSDAVQRGNQNILDYVLQLDIGPTLTEERWIQAVRKFRNFPEILKYLFWYPYERDVSGLFEYTDPEIVNLVLSRPSTRVNERILKQLLQNGFTEEIQKLIRERKFSLRENMPMYHDFVEDLIRERQYDILAALQEYPDFQLESYLLGLMYTFIENNERELILNLYPLTRDYNEIFLEWAIQNRLNWLIEMIINEDQIFDPDYIKKILNLPESKSMKNILLRNPQILREALENPKFNSETSRIIKPFLQGLESKNPQRTFLDYYGGILDAKPDTLQYQTMRKLLQK